MSCRNVEKSAALASTKASVCRMSWFLVQVDQGLVSGKLANGKKAYYILHNVDLIDGDSVNMYIDRMVKFKLGSAILNGKVVFASDDKALVEKHLVGISIDDDSICAETTNPDKAYLVQYKKGPNVLIHAVIKLRDISWPTLDIQKHDEIIFRDGKMQRLAKILQRSNKEDLLMEQLMKLKENCFEIGFDEHDLETNIEPTPWLLVQYSASPTNITYALINYEDTIWKTENMYKDVVAYLSDGLAVYHAVIVRKSYNRDELERTLNKIRDCCASSTYPITKADDFNFKKLPKMPSKNQGILTIDMRFPNSGNKPPIDDLNLSVDDILKETESRLHNEAARLTNLFHKMDHTRQMMEERLNMLKRI